VSAIFGIYKALRKVTVVHASPSGNSISTSPRPNALIQVPSAVRTSWGSITVNVMNLARSRQKCDVAPESMIAPRCASACGCARACGTAAAVANAKFAGGGGGAAVWEVDRLCDLILIRLGFCKTKSIVHS
jgi:hypothetical protein